MKEKAQIMDEIEMTRAISRIAYEIMEKNKGIDDVVLVGIQRRGVPLARKIADKIQQQEGKPVPVGILDITFYRDDLSMLAEHPIVNTTELDFVITDKIIILGRCALHR